MTTSCVPNAYTTICTSTIYSMISGLETLKLPVYQDIILDSNSITGKPSLFTIFPIRWAAASYMLVQSDIDGSLKFWSVNMTEHNVLTANYNTFNVIPGLIVNYRSIVILKYKDKSFQFKFSVPFIDQLVGTKNKIQNMFNENIKAYVLYDKIVFCFVQVEGDQYYRFIYAGILDMVNEYLIVQNTTHFDYNNGTLVGLIDKKPYMLYNRYGLQSVNLYPFTNYSPFIVTGNQLVIGGLNNYFLEPEDASKPNQWKVNYSFELQYQAPYLQTDPVWGYVPLQTMINISNTCDFPYPATGPSFIMAFNNIYLPTQVNLGNTQFLNTDNTIITFHLPIIYTSDPKAEKWDTYPIGGPLPPPDPCCPNDYLYYFFNKDNITIYQPTFENFLLANAGGISIEDLKFSAIRNEEFIKVQNTRMFCTTKQYEMYNHEYKDVNYYFMNSEHMHKEDPSVAVAVADPAADPSVAVAVATSPQARMHELDCNKNPRSYSQLRKYSKPCYFYN